MTTTREAEPGTATSSTVATPTTTVPATVLGVTVTSILHQPELSEESAVTTAGIHPVRIGMTVDEASEAAGLALIPLTEATPRCYFVEPEGGPVGVALMVYDGKIVRVDVNSGRVTTKSGIGIGSTEEEILELFGNQIEITEHFFTTGHYLTFVPVDDTGFRVVFETDGSVVVNFRSGQLPQVLWIEGCN